MRGKSYLASGLLCAALAATLIVPASAHCGRGRGHHGGYTRNVQTAITVCPYEDCAVSGRHDHNGVHYCGYAHGSGTCDGSCIAAVCPYEDCSAFGRHYHSGVRYCGYAHESGICDGSCTVTACFYEDCGVSGRHYHNGVLYCGRS